MSSHLIYQSSFLLFLTFDLVTSSSTHHFSSCISEPFGSELFGPRYRTPPSVAVVVDPLLLRDIVTISVDLAHQPFLPLFLIEGCHARDQGDEA
jgi:hypothetical protein